MSVLSDGARREVWSGLMRSLPAPIQATKPQLRGCVDTADSWVESVFADLAAALPEAVSSTGPAHILLANSAAIARSASITDVSEGVASREQSGVLLTAYNAAAAWLTANITSYLTALGVDGQSLSTGQALAVLESVCRKRAE